LDTRNAYNDASRAPGGLDARRPHQNLILPDISNLPPGLVPAVVGRMAFAGTIENQVNRVSADYHALHAKLQRRLARDVSFTTSDTWAK